MAAWIPYLNNPLVFFSFIFLILVGVIKAFLRGGKLTRNSSTAIINKILNGVFIIALLVFAGTMTNLFSRPAQTGRIKFDSSGPLVYTGTPELISATVFDTNGKQISDKDVNWASMNPEVVGITSVGSFETPAGRVYQARLTGIVHGTALVEASRDGYSEKILVTVSDRNAAISRPASMTTSRPLNALKSANELRPLSELKSSNESNTLHGSRPLTEAKP